MIKMIDRLSELKKGAAGVNVDDVAIDIDDPNGGGGTVAKLKISALCLFRRSTLTVVSLFTTFLNQVKMEVGHSCRNFLVMLST